MVNGFGDLITNTLSNNELDQMADLRKFYPSDALSSIQQGRVNPDIRQPDNRGRFICSTHRIFDQVHPSIPLEIKRDNIDFRDVKIDLTKPRANLGYVSLKQQIDRDNKRFIDN